MAPELRKKIPKEIIIEVVTKPELKSIAKKKRKLIKSKKKGEKGKKAKPKVIQVKKTVRRNPRKPVIGELKVPKELYEKTLEEIKIPRTSLDVMRQQYETHVSVQSQQHCHLSYLSNESYSARSSMEGILSHVNFLKAAKEAFERRDFKNLYKIVIKGYEMNNVR